ncbi:sensor histidine kinase [uncultured Hymenobacter sp.]|uniref:sensor histidine kinase n=1 Tax=uncultured Hymenobacter sp. TaxID=170016 RepID=UPI0035C9C98B
MNFFLAAHRPSRSDLLLVAAYWLVASLVIFPTYVLKVSVARALAAMTYNVALDTAAVGFIVFYFLPRVLEPRTRWAGLLLIPLFVLLSGGLYNVGYGLILQQPSAWTPLNLISGVIRHGQSYGVLGIMLVGKNYFEAQRRILLLQKAQAESELRNLKAQVDPHFLFNNLHVLHVLIGQDAEVAAHYLNCFAGLYRYLIRHRDADFVPLADELRFLDEYMYLLRHRFGAAYAFQTNLASGLDPTQLYAVPGTLQILLENAIKHNRGDEDAPLLITLDVQPTGLEVRNPRRPKRHATGEPGGTGLLNLRERYRLLAGQPVRVQATEAEFTVTVPLLRQTPRR